MRKVRECAWLVLLAGVVTACGGADDNPAGAAGTGGSGDSETTSGNQGSSRSAASGDPNGPEDSNSGSAGETIGDGGGTSGSAGTGAQDPTGGEATAEQPAEVLDPDVDWTALTLVYDKMYSAYVEGITFQVPVYVRDVTVDVSNWSAIPSSAVIFDADPDTGGVILTVLEPVPEITIAAHNGDLGGTAPLFITEGTLEQFQAGEARYANGVELNIELDPGMTLNDIINNLDPNYMPPEPPDDLACNNCHTTGAKYFEIQHTPTQAARFSDDDLRTILTEGRKPEGVRFRVFPDDLMLFGMTNEELYAQFHTWTATEDEIDGLIIYLRSLTPMGQGDILLPDGTYVEPGTAPER